MIDGKGMLPGDVLTASNGKTVEVSQLFVVLSFCIRATHYHNPSPKPLNHKVHMQ